MRRHFAVFVVILALSGCNRSNSLAPTDPFFGSTRVPAPRTSMLPKRPAADPYYSSRRDAVRPSEPGSALEAPTTGAIASRYEPPGETFKSEGNREQPAASAVASAGARKSGDLITIPATARRETDWLAQGPAVSSSGSRAKSQPSANPSVPTPRAGTLARRETVKQTLQTRPRMETPLGRRGTILPVPKAADNRTSRPTRSDGLMDLMDLPPAGTSGSTKPRFIDGNVRQAVATEEVSSSTEGGRSVESKKVASQSSLDRARYGYDPQYKWLKGKLEYSQRDRRWKLRYIPISGETDDYGGSVVLDDESRLSGYERGDFIKVHGQIGRAAEEEKGFAPDFQISRVVPVDR